MDRLLQVTDRAVTYEHFRGAPSLRDRIFVPQGPKTGDFVPQNFDSIFWGTVRPSGTPVKILRDGRRSLLGQSAEPYNPGSFTFSSDVSLREI